MASAKVTSKGQVTLPASVRQSLGITTGDIVDFIEIAPGRFEMIVPSGSVLALKGAAGHIEKALTIDEMNEVIAKSASRSG